MARPKSRFISEDKFPDDWYTQVLDLYSEGASDVEVKALIYKWRGTFSHDLWERWIKEEPEFSETIKTGKLLSEAWWHKSGRTNLQNKEFNFTGWYMNMKNRFGWRDRSELEAKVTQVQPILGGSALSSKAVSKIVEGEIVNALPSDNSDSQAS